MPRKISPEEQLLKIFSANASDEVKAKLLAVVEEKKKFKQTEDEKALEAEGVLFYFHTKGKDFVKQKCSECGRIFAYKYHIPGMNFKCSNECRRASLKKMGIEWNPHKTPEERWGMSGVSHGVIPVIIPPNALIAAESKIQESHVDNKPPVA